MSFLRRKQRVIFTPHSERERGEAWTFPWIHSWAALLRGDKAPLSRDQEEPSSSVKDRELHGFPWPQLIYISDPPSSLVEIRYELFVPCSVWQQWCFVFRGRVLMMEGDESVEAFLLGCVWFFLFFFFYCWCSPFSCSRVLHTTLSCELKTGVSDGRSKTCKISERW